MDAKITKKRLNILLSYDWIKIVLTIAAAIIVWSLIFTMTATRVTMAQSFTIFNYTGTSTTTRFSSYSSLLANEGVFSYDILEITPTDITMSAEYSETILQTRIATGEGDVLFAANVEDPDTEYTDPTNDDAETNKYHPTYLQEFLLGYYSLAENFDDGGYFDQMRTFLNGYYGGDYRTGTADEAKIKADFRARIKANGDKRFKKEAEKQRGEQQEIERIVGYRDSLIEFEGYLEKGYIAFETTTLYFSDAGSVTGTFSINLCPDEATMGGLKGDVYYYETVEGEDGSKTDVATAKDLNVVFLGMGEDNSNRWESVSFVNYLVRTYLTVA